MELANEFEVPLSIDDAWRVLTDLERVAPCMPGAQLQEVEGSEYRGLVRVKVGPITVDYKGTASFVELDEAGHHAVLKASGRETRGQGNATATVHATLEPRDGTTHVSITTELDITGRVAQFGRGALADVSSRLLGQFADNLAKDLNSGGTAAPSEHVAGNGNTGTTKESDSTNGAGDAAVAVAGDEGSGPGAASTRSETESEGGGTIRRIDSAPAAPVKLTSLLGGPLAKRIAPVVAILAAIGLVLRNRLRRRT